MNYNRTRIVHPWGPVFDSESRVLILGTIPSPKSREAGFSYGHPQNIFWETLATVLGKQTPEYDTGTRKMFVLENHIAIWDVLHSCEIDGASDFSIRNPVPNKFASLLEKTKIEKIFTTGKKATELFERLCVDEAGMKPVYLPSTSPANRAMHKRPDFLSLWNEVAKALN